MGNRLSCHFFTAIGKQKEKVSMLFSERLLWLSVIVCSFNTDLFQGIMLNFAPFFISDEKNGTLVILDSFHK